MGHQEMHKSSSPLPVLSRLDRLDHLMEFLEENHCLSWRQHGTWSEEREMTDHCCNKTLSLALKEVHDKGSLMDRLAMLENRVLQLSLAMDVNENMSMSSSSGPTIYPYPCEKQDNNPAITLQENQDGPLQTKVEVEEEGVKMKKPLEYRKRRVSTMKYGKWFGWFPIGC